MTEWGKMMEEKKKWAGGVVEEKKAEAEAAADTTTDDFTGDEWESWSTQFQWDWSDVPEAEEIPTEIPKNVLETGRIWG